MRIYLYNFYLNRIRTHEDIAAYSQTYSSIGTYRFKPIDL